MSKFADMIVDAYKKTGLKPIGVWFATMEKDKRLCCGLSAFCFSKLSKEEIDKFFEDQTTALGISQNIRDTFKNEDMMWSFMAGFDGCSNTYEDDDNHVGKLWYDIGKETWDKVKDL